MSNNIFFQRFAGVFAKISGSAAAISGIYAFIKELLAPERSLKEIFLSPAAVCVYVFIAITAIFVLLNERYKALQHDNEVLNKKVETLNLALNEASAKVEAALKNNQIATFKDRFFLTTPKLYSDLSDKIHNDIVISQMDIYNTIEPTGIGAKRDTAVRMSIQGYAIADDVNQIQIFAAGDTIAKWEIINFTAYELIAGKKIKLNSRLADNGQDSFLKQIVISYSKKKNKGDLIDIVITWQWPNMLNIEEDDYTALPIAYASETKSASITIHPLIPLTFSETGIYKYCVGQETAEHIKDLTPKKDNTITYIDDNPEYKSCLLLYYKIKK